MGQLRYKVRNWSSYNAALVQRGSLTMWLPEDLQDTWLAEGAKRCGRPTVYGETALEICHLIRALLRLPYRQTQGFVQSLMKLMSLDLPVPSFSHICKYGSTMKIPALPASSAQEIAIDATGIKVSGEGEWKVRAHGPSKRRRWKKVHFSVDVATHEIVATDLTPSNIHDSQRFESLLTPGCRTIFADGAYDDSRRCHTEAQERGARAIIPPRRDAVLGKKRRDQETPRDELILIRDLMEDDWSKSLHYGRRNHVEGAFSRYKRIFTSRFQSICERRQLAELATKVSILNRFTRIGMPDSVPVNCPQIKSMATGLF